MTHFADRLIEAVRRAGNPVLVGLDPVPAQFPKAVREGFGDDLPGLADATRAFGKGIVDAVRGLAPAVKLQAAYFEALGPFGMQAMWDTARHAMDSGLIVLIDGKRNDIGSTAEAYARAYLGDDRHESAWPADALTVNPYLGIDGIAPFLNAANARGKGIFVLVRTSNPSAGDFQDLNADGRPLYEQVARRLGEWGRASVGEGGYSNAGAVVGATYPEQIKALRAQLPHIWFLIPGYGAQGGTAADVAAAFDSRGLGALINNSRAILNAHSRPDLAGRFGADWQGATAEAVRLMIADLQAHIPMPSA
ncbi:MAG: orotidine-5'-phosphate decarboxylase [Isosphaeraceae bacterium]